MLAVIGGAVYYTNWICIPRAEAQKPVNTVTLDNPKKADSGDSQYTINKNNPGSSSKQADDDVQASKDANGDVTISTWDAKEGDLDTTVSSPDSTVSANIGSGGGKITNKDGTYTGKKPAATSAPANTGTGTTSKPTGSTTSKSSSTDTPSGTSSVTSNTTSSTPKNGDTRIVDGKQQMYLGGFGWVDCRSGSTTTADPGQYELAGEQVAEMG